MISKRASLAILLFGWAGACLAQAGLCELEGVEMAPLPSDFSDLLGGERQRIEISADQASLARSGATQLEGNIIVRHGESVLNAQLGSFDPVANIFELSGDVSIEWRGLQLTGNEAIYDSKQGDLRLNEAGFLIRSRPARGTASTIHAGRGDSVKLRDVSYTSCPEGSNSWLLEAREVELDNEAGKGTATGAKLEFQGVPLLYVPYFTFPLDDQRKSGFLTPDFGTSDRNGTDLRVPFYWNMAPNYDMTIAPRLLSKRGIQYNSLFRYLLGSPASYGELDVAFLPRDDLDDDHQRHFVKMDHQTRFQNGWWATLDASDTSDGRYFEDMGGSVATTSLTHLMRMIEFERHSEHWTLLARMRNFQTLDNTLAEEERPYRELPQVVVDGYWPDSYLGLTYKWHSELTHFDRKVGPTGQRLNLRPEIRLPMGNQGMYLEPGMSYQVTGYNLHDPDTNRDESPDVSAPIFTLDSGLRLERDTGRRRTVLQTLEPRLQYVYIPYKRQGDIPLFDTDIPDFSLVELFRPNRFVGPDRLGDANHLSWGITTRIFDPDTGRQFLTATLGQQYFFEDERVTLPGVVPNSANTSDAIAELGFRYFNAWNVDMNLRWDTSREKFDKATVRFQYRPASKSVLNLGYRLIEGQIEQTDFSFGWPVSRRWKAVGRYNYSLRDDTELERFLGLEYQTCCWAIRGVWRRLITDREGEKDTSIMLQLELKGLTNLGSGVESFLRQGILGYNRESY